MHAAVGRMKGTKDPTSDYELKDVPDAFHLNLQQYKNFKVQSIALQ